MDRYAVIGHPISHTKSPLIHGPFLHRARSAGVERLADGVGMLVEQAAEAFVWWRGVRPDTAALITRLTVPLA